MLKKRILRVRPKCKFCDSYARHHGDTILNTVDFMCQEHYNKYKTNEFVLLKPKTRVFISGNKYQA